MNEVKELGAVTLTETNGGKVLEVGLTGKITEDDYRHFVPAVERLVKAHGKIRMLEKCTTFMVGPPALCGRTSSLMPRTLLTLNASPW